jgi:hypothetical protein
MEDNAYPVVAVLVEHTVGLVSEVVADKAVVMVPHKSCCLYLLCTGKLELVGEHNE